MGEYVVRLPDVGEGVAEAELVEWFVSVGDAVAADAHLADVLTDKATIEISAPVAGTVTFLTGAPGDRLAVGSDIVGLEVEGEGNRRGGAPRPATTAAPPTDEADTAPATDGADAATGAGEHDRASDADPSQSPASSAAAAGSAPPAAGRGPAGDRSASAERHGAPAAAATRPPGMRPTASPAVRRRAVTLGLDLRVVPGTGPAGRVTHDDLDHFVAGGGSAGAARRFAAAADSTTKVVGLRRMIADQMVRSAHEIPHITYVDEVDMSALESLRATLNESAADGQRPRLTVLPFLVRAVVVAVRSQPRLNATFDGARGELTVRGAVDVGIATQTNNGLMVPVVRDAAALDLWETAAEIARLGQAARDGSAHRDELRGSSITISSLGALGGLVSTPIINHPEVAIIGVNKLQVRPVWVDGQFVPRSMMNLSSSFDHRIVDGWDAATFIQRIRQLLEQPALLFIDDGVGHA